MKLWAELRRRHVIRIVLAYLVVAWLLVQVAIAIQAPLRLPDWFATFVIVVLAIGFPIALIITWAFELTPDGVKRASPAGAGAGARAGAPVRGGKQAALARDPSSVTVLPLNNMTGEPGLDAMVDGLTEDLITTLAQSMLRLQVTARNSAFRYKNETVDVREAGAALEVRHVVEGGIQKDGAGYKLTLQLIDAVTGAHLWAGAASTPEAGQLARLVSKEGQDVRRELADELQSAIAASIRRAADKAIPKDLAELGAFLDSVPDEHLVRWAHIVFNTPDRAMQDRVPVARAIAERAAERRPDDPRALGACATLLMANAYADKSRDIEAARAQIADLSGRALAIDPRDREVTFFATTALVMTGQTRQAYLIVRSAPHPPPHVRDQVLAIYEDDLDGAITRFEARIASETAPGHRDRMTLTLLYFARGADERAIAMAEETTPLFQEVPLPETVRIAALELSGRSEEAKAAAAKMLARVPHGRFDMWFDVDPAEQRIAPDNPYYRVVGGEMRGALVRAGLLDPPAATGQATEEAAP